MTEKFTHPNDAPEGHRWTLRNGWEWRLLEVNEHGYIVGAYIKDGAWFVSTHYDDGSIVDKLSDLDLIDVPREHTVWVNVWRGWPGRHIYRTHSTEERARVDRDYYGDGNVLVASFSHTFTEGEGL